MEGFPKNENTFFEKAKEYIKKKGTTLGAATLMTVGSLLPQEGQANENTLKDQDVNTIEMTSDTQEQSQLDAQELKKVLKGYEAVAGRIPLGMFLEMHKDKTFTISEATSNTQAAADLEASEELRILGAKGSSGMFVKTLPNGTISVIKVSVNK